MIKSMTGFGKAEYNENGMKIAVEIQSVNSRFLDLKMRLPKYLNEYEPEFRGIVQKYIDRGHVAVSVNIDIPSMKTNSLTVDFGLAEKYVQLARQTADFCKIENRMNVQSLLTMPDVLKIEDNGSKISDNLEIIKNTLITAFENQKKMREKEGAALGADIEKRLELIVAVADEIEKTAPEVIKTNTQKFRKKIESFLEPGQYDENRFTMEAAIYADRVDINEECVRLKSHIELFTHEMKSEPASGKKLSFILQEMNREVNTITSKAMDANISRMVVQIKENLEKMREQIENIE